MSKLRIVTYEEKRNKKREPKMELYSMSEAFYDPYGFHRRDYIPKNIII